MTIVSPAVTVATQKATELADSGNVPTRVKVAGSSYDPSQPWWPRTIAIDIDDATRRFGDEGEWLPGYGIHHFSDDMLVGKGCDQCLHTGRIGVLVHDELEPYICERSCPSCTSGTV